MDPQEKFFIEEIDESDETLENTGVLPNFKRNTKKKMTLISEKFHTEELKQAILSGFRVEVYTQKSKKFRNFEKFWFKLDYFFGKRKHYSVADNILLGINFNYIRKNREIEEFTQDGSTFPLDIQQQDKLINNLEKKEKNPRTSNFLSNFQYSPLKLDLAQLDTKIPKTDRSEKGFGRKSLNKRKTSGNILFKTIFSEDKSQIRSPLFQNNYKTGEKLKFSSQNLALHDLYYLDEIKEDVAEVKILAPTDDNECGVSEIKNQESFDSMKGPTSKSNFIIQISSQVSICASYEGPLCRICKSNIQ